MYSRGYVDLCVCLFLHTAIFKSRIFRVHTLYQYISESLCIVHLEPNSTYNSHRHRGAGKQAKSPWVSMWHNTTCIFPCHITLQLICQEDIHMLKYSFWLWVISLFENKSIVTTVLAFNSDQKKTVF